MKKFPFLLFLLLSSSLYSQEESIPLPPATQPEACEAFKEVKKSIDQIKYSEEIKKDAVISVALTIAAWQAYKGIDAVMNLRDSAKLAKALNDITDPVIRKAFKLPATPYTPTQLSSLNLRTKRKMASTTFKYFKSILRVSGAATVGVLAIDYYHERSIAKVIRGFISEFSTQAGDATMTASYANDPEKFFALNLEEACRLLGSDKESKSAPLLRQITMEMNALLSVIKEEHQEDIKGSDQSDRSIQIKSDLPSSETNRKSEATGSNQQ